MAFFPGLTLWTPDQNQSVVLISWDYIPIFHPTNINKEVKILLLKILTKVKDYLTLKLYSPVLCFVGMEFSDNNSNKFFYSLYESRGIY